MAKQKIRSAQIETQEAWTQPSMSNGWVNYDNGYAPMRYMKDSLGFVHIEGFIKNGTTTPGTVIFTLPAGYRPAYGMYCPGIANPGSGVGAFAVMANGQVQFINGSATYTSTGYITFRAEA